MISRLIYFYGTPKIYISLPNPKCLAATWVRPASDGAVHAARYTSQRTELQSRVRRWAFHWRTSRFSSASPVIAAEENDCHRTGTGGAGGVSRQRVGLQLRGRTQCALTHANAVRCSNNLFKTNNAVIVNNCSTREAFEGHKMWEYKARRLRRESQVYARENISFLKHAQFFLVLKRVWS